MRFLEALGLIALVALTSPLAAAVIAVDGTDSTAIAGDGICSLREAIDNANGDNDTSGGDCAAGSGADTLELAADVVLTDIDNISFDGAANGLPIILTDVTVDGGGFSVARDAHAPDFRLFYVLEGSLTLLETTVDNGAAGTNKDGGAIWASGPLSLTDCLVTGSSADSGGGIRSSVSLTLETTTIADNDADAGGGGILLAGGTASLTGSVVSDNVAANRGGGVLVDGGTATITESALTGNQADEGGGLFVADGLGPVVVETTEVTGNHATNIGGGIASFGILEVTRSTLWDNSADNFGGGLNFGGTAEVTNSTISGNETPGSGGGIAAFGDLTITNATLSGNIAHVEGGGFYTDLTGNGVFTNTLIANSTGDNCAAGAVVIGNGGNLTDDSTCGTLPANLTGLSTTLDDHGGPTLTHALEEGSNAIDLIVGGCSTPTDQRGAARQGNCDSGAYEFVPCPDLELANAMVTDVEVVEHCQQILVGPSYSVETGGDLTLRAGKLIEIGNGTTVADGGALTLEIDVDLQLTPPPALSRAVSGGRPGRDR